jgi:hypothetical protein
MFDPKIGRWMSQDPIGFDAGDANLYRYVNNNPTNNRDVDGERADEVNVKLERDGSAKVLDEYGSVRAMITVDLPIDVKGMVVQQVKFTFKVFNKDKSAFKDYKKRDVNTDKTVYNIEYYEAWEYGFKDKNDFYPPNKTKPYEGKARDSFETGLYYKEVDKGGELASSFPEGTRGEITIEGSMVFIPDKALYKKRGGGELAKDVLEDGWARLKIPAAGSLPTWDKEGAPPGFPKDATVNHKLTVSWDATVCPIKKTEIKTTP